MQVPNAGHVGCEIPQPGSLAVPALNFDLPLVEDDTLSYLLPAGLSCAPIPKNENTAGQQSAACLTGVTPGIYPDRY